MEAKDPLRVRQYALNIEGGVGAGQHRGGYGAIREFEILGDEAFTYCGIGRSVERPWGLAGGKDGSNNYLDLQSNGTRRKVSRVPYVPLKKGDRVAVVTGGGGGYGDPRARPPTDVAADVKNGYLTPERALEDYGVAVSTEGRIDPAVTAAMRARGV